MCARCFDSRDFPHPAVGTCDERLDKHGAAAIAGVKPDTWARMCADVPPGRARKRQGPAPDWRRVFCVDGRYRDLWLRSTVEEYVANRPGRGGGGGRPRKVRDVIERKARNQEFSWGPCVHL